MQAETPAFFALSITASLSCTAQDAPLTVSHRGSYSFAWPFLWKSKAIMWHSHEAPPHDIDVCQNSMHKN